MTAGCAACGLCCNPVDIEADVFLGCTERARSRETVSHNDRFIAQHWRPVSASPDENGTSWLSVRCDAFDSDSRLCTAREDRPPVCRDYPWYGGEPDAERGLFLPPQCSYQADLPPGDRAPGTRPLIPLEVLR